MLRLFEYDKLINEQKKKIEEYQKLNALEKYIKKLKKEKLKEVGPVLFVVQYRNIGMPFQKTDIFRVWCNHELYNASIEQIPTPDIDNLWTIVQYEGDGVFKDLTTDKKFRLAHYEEYVKEKLSNVRTEKDYKEAYDLYAKLMTIPLGISDESRDLGKDLNLIYFGPLKELTPEMEIEIAKETMTKKEMIKKALLIKEEKAKKKIIEKYGYLYTNFILENTSNFGQNNVNKRL